MDLFISIMLLHLLTALRYVTYVTSDQELPKESDKLELFTNFFNLYSVDLKKLSDFGASPGCKGCPGVYYPVCGDDNITYLNECKLACLNIVKKKDPKVTMVRTGPCFVFPEF